MQKTLSITEAVTQLWQIAKANRIPGMPEHEARALDGPLPSQLLSAGFSLRWERGWGIDARLNVYSDIRGRDELTLRVEVGWSSSTFKAHSAKAAADLHSAVASLACWMQAEVDSMPALVVDKAPKKAVTP